MLTVDYDRLGLTSGDRLLDMGCGAGRHAFEAVRRGAVVTAFDYSDRDVKDAAAILVAMDQEAVANGTPLDGRGDACCGDGCRLPFPDDTFDRVIASEVLEHIPDDVGAISEMVRVLKPGGTIAATVPRWFPELVNWALSDQYHAPYAVGGHIRIYRRSVLSGRLRDAGLTLEGIGFAHGLHSPYWWLKCAVGIENPDHPLVRAYHKLLVWDIENGRPLPTRLADAALNPFISKSIVLYARKPAQVPALTSTLTSTVTSTLTSVGSSR